MIFNSFLVQNGWKDVEVINFGIPDHFVQFGSHTELMKEIGLEAEPIASRILQERPRENEPVEEAEIC
jgi:1-deoxy-D-xylulose-5-phosphate synthase